MFTVMAFLVDVFFLAISALFFVTVALYSLSQWLKSLVALQCDIAQRLTKASIPSKTNSTNVIIKSERKPSLSDEKSKEKKEETPEISLETNEKMIIDDEVSESPESRNEGCVFPLFVCFVF